MRFHVVIAATGYKMDESEDRAEAMRMADARTYNDRILHTVHDTKGHEASLFTV